MVLVGWLEHGGDAESLLRDYLARGLSALSSNRGEFSFVLWDPPLHRVVGGCDVLARRPLAYFTTPSHASFASRVTDLVGHPSAPRRWNYEYLADWLAGLASQPQEVTAFAGIARCPPGCAVIWEHGITSVRRLDALSGARDALGREGDLRSEFWVRLGCSVRRLHEGSAVALSGGLDSATVASARLSFADQGLDAYSYVADSWAGCDERVGISSFLRLHPSVRWHPVDVCGVRTDSELHPLPDDPDTGAAALRPARRQLLRCASVRGERGVMDGEGGDEIFEIAIEWGDLIQVGRPLSALRFLALDARWGGPAIRRGIVRRLAAGFPQTFPSGVSHPRALLPKWTTERFRKSDDFRAALAKFETRTTQRAFADRLASILTGGAFVGGRSADRLEARSLGLDVASPLVNAAIVEFAMGLTPEQRMAFNSEKSFLRKAGAGILPESTLRAEKDNALYRTMLRYVLRDATAERTLSHLERVRGFREWVDSGVLRRQYSDPSRLSVRDADSLYRLQRGTEWMSEVEQRYALR